MSSLMESLGRAHIHIQPDYLVLVERRDLRAPGRAVRKREAWNDACTADHQTLFARVRLDVPTLSNWINSRFEGSVYDDPHSPLHHRGEQQ